MSQINVNPGHDHVDVVDSSGDRSAAAGINLITVLIVLGVLAVIAWYLFTGPLRSMGAGGTTKINVTPAPPRPTPTTTPPTQPNAPAPANNTGTGNTGTGTGTGGGTGGNPPPANP